ncbi:MAG TPA: hypothetical protein DEQ09_02645 [Bacteroidales bacterium]|nr:hypothetical protein [Bacteroidales bacterium]
MSNKKFLIPLFILFIILTLTGCLGKFINTPPLDDQTGTLILDPNQLTLTPGEDFTVSLITPSVQNLKAYSVTLSYDPKLIRLNEVTEGTFFSSKGETFFYRDIDNQQGSVLMDCAILGRDLAVSGQGVLATLSFTCLKTGSASITFKAADTRDTYNGTIVTTQKGTLVKSR